MPINGTLNPFRKDYINAYAPNSMGVYGLYDSQEVVYYGMAKTSTVRDRLLSHQAGHEGPCTQAATHFNTEVTSNPEARERELLLEHQRTFGRLPRCNDVVP